MVDKERAKGAVDKVKGKIKEKTGQITGDHETEARGKADQDKGKVRDKVGKGKDKVRDALDK